MRGLSNLLTIFRRELAAYFNAAIAYIFIIVFVLLNGGIFMTGFFIINRVDMRAFFGSLPLTLAVFLPAVSMRLWAEEKKGNTMELLLTFPMAAHELVLGKYLASLVFYLVTLAGTLTIPLMLHFLGSPDLGAITAGYVGSLLLGALFLAIGIFISGLASDQIVAFILAMMACFSLHLLGTEFFAASLDGWVPGLGTLLRNYIGTARHFDSFAKGVVDNRDVIYFLLGSVIFLVLNGFWLEGRMRAKAKAIFTTATVISIGIFLMGNLLLAGIPLGRFDLTQGQLYTISPATLKILADLKAPVLAKFYVSPVEKMPTAMKSLEQEVRDKLDELRVASKGKFQYKIFYMEAANVTEEGQQANAESLEQQLSEKGIKPFQVQSINADEMGIQLIYSSISLGHKEKVEEIIPRIIPGNLYELEYLIVSRIYRMMLPEPPRAALVAPYTEKEVEPQLKALLSQLGGEVPKGYREDNYEVLPMALQYAGYEVTRIKFDEKEPIPDKTKTLIIMEPREFNDRQKYELNRFLRSGGSLLLAVQNYEYEYTASGQDLKIRSKEKNPTVNPLISNWGFEVDDKILVDKLHDLVTLSGSRLGPFEVSVPVKVPIQILVNQEGMNQDLSITSRLSSLFYLWGTALQINEQKVKEQGLKLETLLTSSPESWIVPFRSGELTPTDLNPKPESKQGPFPLAVMVQGQFTDVYQGKPVPLWPQAENAGIEIKSVETVPAPITPAPGKMILIGASSLFQKQLVRSGGHLNFFLNTIDALSLGDELVTIRSKQPVERSLGRISAATKVGWRFFVTLLIPIAAAVIGTLCLFFRKQSKRNYLKVLSLVE